MTSDAQRDVQEHRLESKFVDQTFRISVWHPPKAAEFEQLPVLYATDGDFFFGGCTDLARSLQAAQECASFILVAIGYGSPRAAALLRARDLYTHEVRRYFHKALQAYAASQKSSVGVELETVTHTTDSSEFLRFIQRELVPFINERYRVVPNDAAYFGYSAGGGFGLRTLCSEPATFKRYLLGSPATSYGAHHYALEWIEAARRVGLAMDAKLFASVGDLEEMDDGLENCNMVSGFHRLVAELALHPLPGLTLTWRAFPGETHASAWSQAFSHGVRALFPPSRV